MTQKLSWRRTGAAFSASLLLAAAAHAQVSWPQRAITVVVPFGTGSGSDLGSRILAKDLAQELGVTVVVDNKPGANGAIGAKTVAKAAPDGYTLLVGSGTTNAVNYAYFGPRLGYKPEAFKAVGGMGFSALSLYVSTDAPWQSLADLVAAAKKQPGTFSCGSGNSVTQVACAVFKKRAGIDSVNAPYKSNSQSLTDLAGGQLSYAFSDASAAQILVDGKRVRPLAVAAEKRAEAMPDVPTFAEQGFDDFVFTGWTAVFAPAGTPGPIVNKLNEMVRRSNNGAEATALRKHSGSGLLDFDTAAAQQYVDAEVRRWTAYVKDANVKVE